MCDARLWRASHGRLRPPHGHPRRDHRTRYDGGAGGPGPRRSPTPLRPRRPLDGRHRRHGDRPQRLPASSASPSSTPIPAPNSPRSPPAASPRSKRPARAAFARLCATRLNRTTSPKALTNNAFSTFAWTWRSPSVPRSSNASPRPRGTPRLSGYSLGLRPDRIGPDGRGRRLCPIDHHDLMYALLRHSRFVIISGRPPADPRERCPNDFGVERLAYGVCMTDLGVS